MSSPLPPPEPLSVLPVPHMMALVMSQLQPILKGFNRSLEHLSRQVGHLARDVAQLKSSRLVEKRQVPLDGLEPGEAADEHLDANLDQVFQQMAAIRQQMERQRADVDNRLHSQHAVLHYNLTSFKADVDTELKQHQKMLQVCRLTSGWDQLLPKVKPNQPFLLKLKSFLSLIPGQPAGHERHPD